ncbi:27588_t:CDS:2, partial [Racocetra persica]
MVNAQEWLDKNYPKKEKARKYLFVKEQLEGELYLKDFTNLKKVYISYYVNEKQFTINYEGKIELNLKNKNLEGGLDLSDFVNLEELECDNNNSNNLSEQDCSAFSQFGNLENLKIGNHDENKINQKIYNRFMGSLEPFKNSNKLKHLNISNTDIASGVEHLPQSIGKIRYSSELRPTSKVQEIDRELSRKAEEFNRTLLPNEIRFPKYKKHEEAVYTSRLLPTEEIIKLLQNSKEISEQFYDVTETPESFKIDLVNFMEDSSPNLAKKEAKTKQKLLREILVRNNLIKETFLKQTISNLEEQMRLFSQEKNIGQQNLKIYQLQESFAKLQTDLEKSYQLSTELDELMLQQEISPKKRVSQKINIDIPDEPNAQVSESAHLIEKSKRKLSLALQEKNTQGESKLLKEESDCQIEFMEHYKLKEDERRFFAHLPPNFPKEEFDRAKGVYAGILTANYPESVEKYLTSGDECQPRREALNELVIFAHSWWQTDAGRAIYSMFDLET